jgi:hypothetical protein
MSATQLRGNVVYTFHGAEARVSPLVFGGLGVTVFRADEIPTETQFSVGVGGGLDYFPWPAVGFRGQFQYKPTMLSPESAGDFCDPFGFCQNILSQVGVLAGVAFRF